MGRCATLELDGTTSCNRVAATRPPSRSSAAAAAGCCSSTSAVPWCYSAPSSSLASWSPRRAATPSYTCIMCTTSWWRSSCGCSAWRSRRCRSSSRRASRGSRSPAPPSRRRRSATTTFYLAASSHSPKPCCIILWCLHSIGDHHLFFRALLSRRNLALCCVIALDRPLLVSYHASIYIFTIQIVCHCNGNVELWWLSNAMCEKTSSENLLYIGDLLNI